MRFIRFIKCIKGLESWICELFMIYKNVKGAIGDFPKAGENGMCEKYNRLTLKKVLFLTQSGCTK